MYGLAQIAEDKPHCKLFGVGAPNNLPRRACLGTAMKSSQTDTKCSASSDAVSQC